MPVLLELKPTHGFGILIGPQLSRQLTGNGSNKYGEWEDHIDRFDLYGVFGLRFGLGERVDLGIRYAVELNPERYGSEEVLTFKDGMRGNGSISLGFKF